MAACLDHGSIVERHYATQHGFKNREGRYTRAGKLNILNNIVLIALFSLGIVAATAGITPATAGWTALGLGCGGLILPVCGGNLRNRKIDLLIGSASMIAVIALGALGGSGVLAASVVGYALIGIVGGQGILYACCCRAYAAHQLRTRTHHTD